MDENNINEFTELQPGTGLNGGKYIIEKKIGEGGFGITYKAIQSGLDRPVCIKEYFPAGRCVRDTYARTIHIQGMDQDKFEKYRQSFVKEARTLAGLRHSSIVEVIDIFDENNTSYMVMPFIEGRSLQAIVDKEGPLTYPEAVNYMAQITDAVGYIHERHILHRDIKPDNIMITADYKAILIDFGSAREFVEDKTQAQTSMLTHGYAPTEQYTTTSRKGSYTDIYAIGATLYFILTGKVPMEAAARITEHMPEPRELRPDLPEEANRTIMKAMQLKSSDRHQTVKEFMDDLRNIHPSEPGPTQATEAPKPPKQTVQAKTEAAPKAQQTVASSDVKPAGAKKNKGLIWGLVAALVVVVAVVVVMLVGGGDKETTSAAANAQTQYKEMAARCMSQISLGGTSNTQELLNAKALLDSIRSMEAQYGAEIPDVYNRSNELNAAIEPKLKQAAADWAEEGDNLMNEFKDYPKAIENYTLSLQLKEDPAVREKLEYAKNQK